MSTQVQAQVISKPTSSLLRLHGTKTLTESQPVEVQRPSLTQSQSPLFSELPAELRYQIWNDLLDNFALDLILVNGEARLRPPQRSGNLLSMLLACRQSYVELSSLLYSTKSLHIQHPSTLVRLSNTIASEHINAITSLHLIWPLIGLPHLSYINLGSYHLHQNEVEAMAIWDTISNMKGLKQLHVELNVPAVWRDSWKGWEGILLDCLLEVGGWGEDRVVEDFGLWIPWPKLEFREEMGRFVKKLGCKIFWS